MASLSEKQKQLFWQIGLSQKVTSWYEEEKITLRGLFDIAVYHCFREDLKGRAVTSLRKYLVYIEDFCNGYLEEGMIPDHAIELDEVKND